MDWEEPKPSLSKGDPSIRALTGVNPREATTMVTKLEKRVQKERQRALDQESLKDNKPRGALTAVCHFRAGVRAKTGPKSFSKGQEKTDTSCNETILIAY